MADVAEFAEGLLNPQHPVPALVKGQPARRYGVYRNNVTVGLVRALEANFPFVRKLLGEQYFAGFAREFAQSHPPQSPLMFTYGAAFPQWLETAEDLASYPYLSDVARLEILWRESYHAGDAPLLASKHLQSVEPNILFSSLLRAHPAMRLMSSGFAVHAIVRANMPGAGQQVFDPAESQCVLITRPQYDVEIRALMPEQFAFFLALQQGQSFGEALDRAAAVNIEFDLTMTMAIMLQSGAFESIQPSAT